jgi:hypothetical protein
VTTQLPKEIRPWTKVIPRNDHTVLKRIHDATSITLLAQRCKRIWESQNRQGGGVRPRFRPGPVRATRHRVEAGSADDSRRHPIARILTCNSRQSPLFVAGAL